MPVVYSNCGANLFKNVVKELLKRLSSFGNEIEAHTRFALESLIYTFEQGLTGNLSHSYFLSSLDPGLGKTEAIAVFIKIWKASGFTPEGSILIGLHSKDEIRALIKRLDLDSEDFAVLTGDPSLNVLGKGEGRQRQARILITTQQMIISRTSDRNFASAREFFFGDATRALRIWDESFVLAQPVTLALASIYGLIEPLKSNYRHFADDLIALLKPMDVASAGDLFAIPGSIKKQAGAILAGQNENGKLESRVERTLEALQKVGGRSMRLLRHGGNAGHEHGASGLTLIGASRPIPPDFAPAIILDASGRVRGTYEAWEHGIGNLVRLPAKTNTYPNVTFKLWIEKCGKAALRDPEISRLIFRNVAKAIEQHAGEHWLLVSDKANDSLDVAEGVRATIKPGIRLGAIHWGKHHGTNDYKAVRHIMVIGSHFYDALAYKALAVAASGLPIIDVPVEIGEGMEASEWQHNMLQAVMRGNARNSSSGVAGECTVYVVASPRLNAAALLRETFPGCKIEEWLPRQAKLSGQGKKLVDHLIERLFIRGQRRVTKKEVRDAIGISNKQQLAPLLKSLLVKEALTKVGIHSDNTSFFVR